MLGDWRRRHGRELGVLVLPIGALLVMLILVLAIGRYPS